MTDLLPQLRIVPLPAGFSIPSYMLCCDFLLLLTKGTLVSSHAEFGDSWLVEGSDCTAVTVDTHPCEIAGYEVKKQAIEQCAIIQVIRSYIITL